jgi:hypothetical protein
MSPVAPIVGEIITPFSVFSKAGPTNFIRFLVVVATATFKVSLRLKDCLLLNLLFTIIGLKE